MAYLHVNHLYLCTCLLMCMRQTISSCRTVYVKVASLFQFHGSEVLWSVDNRLSHWIFHLLSLWRFFVCCCPYDTQDWARKGILASHLILRHPHICHFGVTQSSDRPQASASNNNGSVQTEPNYYDFSIKNGRNVQISLRCSFSMLGRWQLPYQQSRGG